ncbi:Protein CBG21463 [Caenorhabditis briggsae]|uniref:Protein CBG21463 n=1 Tax=Caenorhabditis briggsae TaxID=6238 RepID=A8Y037_CAEBR|nr:Protein CBG21463 [Caenorhabditis briggsae]CAP38255.2 Protein CBG21463 [Caenorhabditis briggsae]
MSGQPTNNEYPGPPPEILAQIQNPANVRIENPPQIGEVIQNNPRGGGNAGNAPQAPQPPPPNAQNNSLNAARDRLFHAMLVRVALKYSGKVNLRMRRLIEGVLLFLALVLLASLLFIHLNLYRSPVTCLKSIDADWIRKGILRIEVVRNLDVLEEKEKFITAYNREPREYEYLYRVEYAMMLGVLRLPSDFRDEHGIPMTWLRIDSKSTCFGDQISRLMMRLFVGYEDTVIAALRIKAANLSLVNPETLSMGYLHNMATHDQFHFVQHSLGKASYLVAAILVIIFTFAISMLLRFSHHQIFVFIIDLLHMFELQQPLNPPVAPLITVVLALVGMEAIMAEVFMDTSIAFYVILIVWVADQYDAICCHSATSKKFWLRFFYIYQFFFYSYQYRFNGQYGGLALLTSSIFILHSMVYFFHHYEMPLILYQDRVSQVLADLHAPQNGMGTVEVQTITVAIHNHRNNNNASAAAAATTTGHPDGQTHESMIGDGDGSQGNERPMEPLSPSSVFDARGPNLVVEEPAQADASDMEIEVERAPMLPEEIIAHQIVTDAMNELFNTHQE